MSKLPQKKDVILERFLDATALMAATIGVVISIAFLGFFAYAIYQTVADQSSDGDTFTLNRNEWTCASERSIPRFSSTAILVTKKCDIWVRREK
ncbi:hypothetical protein GOC55_13080 [Sinorhizobium medicae]|nr:hypothetical protein [Sinorhizobium medicae]